MTDASHVRPPSREVERADLIALCERGVLTEHRWMNRDSAGAQMQLGRALALLRAGCEFRLADDPVSTDKTLWVRINYRGFDYFEGDFDGLTPMSEDLFYLPTAARLEEANGGDWY